MNLSSRVVLAVACAWALNGSSFADPVTEVVTDPAAARNQDARIAGLEAQVALLKSDGWLTRERADEVRALVHDVLADADTRASLLQSGMTAGYDDGFMIGSSDGVFALKIKGELQVRHITNNQDDYVAPGPPPVLNDSTQSGFEIGRAKLAFAGHVYDRTWKYKVEGGFERSGGAFVLEDAYIDKDMGDGWTLRLGQFKLPVLREESMESYDQLAVDRSLLNEKFNQGISQGIQISRAYDQFRWFFAYSDGANSRNTTYSGPTPATALLPTEYALSFRAEALMAGDWDQFEDFSGWRGGEFGLMLGGAIHYQEGESGTDPVPSMQELQLTLYTFDISAEWDGANAYAAFVYTDFDPAANNENPWGFVVQGGYFLSDTWELFARYEYGDEDDNTTADIDDLGIITVGVNKYFARHGLKLTTDIGFGINSVSSFWGTAGGGIGWRTDQPTVGAQPGQEDQLVLRGQLQMTF